MPALATQTVSVKLMREEKRETFQQETLKAWEEYQETGLHVTGDDVIAWLKTWSEENEKAAPVCHHSINKNTTSYL